MAAVADTTCTVSNLVSTGSQVKSQTVDVDAFDVSGVGLFDETVDKKKCPKKWTQKRYEKVWS